MAQKPMLRAEVYAHAMRASQNRKKEVRKSSYVLTSESGGRATHTVIELSFHLESNVALATRNRLMRVGRSHEGFMFVFSVSEDNYLRKTSDNSSARPGRLQGTTKYITTYTTQTPLLRQRF